MRIQGRITSYQMEYENDPGYYALGRSRAVGGGPRNIRIKVTIEVDYAEGNYRDIQMGDPTSLAIGYHEPPAIEPVRPQAAAPPPTPPAPKEPPKPAEDPLETTRFRLLEVD